MLRFPGPDISRRPPLPEHRILGGTQAMLRFPGADISRRPPLPEHRILGGAQAGHSWGSFWPPRGLPTSLGERRWRGTKIAWTSLQNRSIEPLGHHIGPTRVSKVTWEALETRWEAPGKPGSDFERPQGTKRAAYPSGGWPGRPPGTGRRATSTNRTIASLNVETCGNLESRRF